MIELQQVFLVKARECLAGAESEFVNERYNNAANRCYYAVFQAAVHALARAGIWPPGGPQAEWGHAFVQGQFVRELINRKHFYPTDLRATISDNLSLRQRADYEVQCVSQTQALRALRRTRQFIEAIQGQGGRAR